MWLEKAVHGWAAKKLQCRSLGTFAGVGIGEHFWKLLSRSRPRFQELGSWDLCHSDLGIKKRVISFPSHELVTECEVTSPLNLDSLSELLGSFEV